MPLGEWPGTPGAWHGVLFPCGPGNSQITQNGFFNIGVIGPLAKAKVVITFANTVNYGQGTGLKVLQIVTVELNETGCRREQQCPDNTDMIVVNILEATGPIVWGLELKAK